MTTYEPPAEAVEKADTDPEVQRIAAALGVNPAERESFIRAALTAAGPTIAAEAWDEGFAAGVNTDMGDHEHPPEVFTNPYTKKGTTDRVKVIVRTREEVQADIDALAQRRPWLPGWVDAYCCTGCAIEDARFAYGDDGARDVERYAELTWLLREIGQPRPTGGGMTARETTLGALTAADLGKRVRVDGGKRFTLGAVLHSGDVTVPYVDEPPWLRPPGDATTPVTVYDEEEA